MAELNYTKGEWELQRPYIDEPILIIAGKRVGSRGVIAQVSMTKEQLANAHLIAATPDFYEACRAIISERFDDWSPMYKQIAKALAKAEGKDD